MTVSKVVALTALVAMSAAVVFAQAVRRDGKWEITMQMEMPGMPAMPPFTAEQCVTKEQANEPPSAMPQQPGAKSDCKTEDYKSTGNKVSWSMKCTTPQPMTGNGELTYTDNAYTGVMKMNTVGAGGQPMAMTMKMTGKRLGDCVK